MAEARTVAVLVGSLRKDSFNRKMANALVKIAPGELKLEIVEIDDLDFYNEDVEADTPRSWMNFRAKIGRASCRERV